MEKNSPTNVSFEGLTPETAEKLFKGMENAAGAPVREVFARLDEIKKMKLEDVEKLNRVLEKSARANGVCVIGCG